MKALLIVSLTGALILSATSSCTRPAPSSPAKWTFDGKKIDPPSNSITYWKFDGPGEVRGRRVLVRLMRDESNDSYKLVEMSSPVEGNVLMEKLFFGMSKVGPVLLLAVGSQTMSAEFTDMQMSIVGEDVANPKMRALMHDCFVSSGLTKNEGLPHYSAVVYELDGGKGYIFGISYW